MTAPMRTDDFARLLGPVQTSNLTCAESNGGGQQLVFGKKDVCSLHSILRHKCTLAVQYDLQRYTMTDVLEKNADTKCSYLFRTEITPTYRTAVMLRKV